MSNTTHVRPVCLGSDIPGIVRLLNACDPADPTTIDELRSEFQHTAPKKFTLRLVAVDEDNTITGYIYVVHSAEAPTHHFYIWMRVDPVHRNRGIGSALWEAALDYLHAQGAIRIACAVLDSDPASLSFAEHRGFTMDRQHFSSTLDLNAFDETPYFPGIASLEAQGIRFCSLADFPDTPETRRKFYDLNFSVVMDIPGENWDYSAYPQFFNDRILGAAWFRREGQLLALDGETWVGFASVSLSHETQSAYNATTGVIHAYRGRKIGLALKVMAARYARQHGAQMIRTDNDSLNTPILAINRKMGYQPQPGTYLLVRYLKENNEFTAENFKTGTSDCCERLRSLIPGWMRTSRTPGVVVSILRAGASPEHICFGVASQASGQSITPETVFQAASLSKPVFAYMTMKLCEMGVLDLDSPLCDYLPDPLLANELRLPLITARRVLSHTTGLPNWSSEDTPLALRFTPGERFSYSGEGYVYLQHAIERLTGKPLDVLMQAEWFQPLGMTGSSFIWRESDEPRMTHAHKLGQPHAEYQFVEPLSAASLYTTPADFARFAAQVLFPPEADAHHLSPQWLETMLTPQVSAGPEMSWGLGWGLVNMDGHRCAWQWGDNAGYKHIAAFSPAVGLGIIVLTNNDQGLQVWKNVLANSIDPQGQIYAWLESMGYL